MDRLEPRLDYYLRRALEINQLKRKRWLAQPGYRVGIMGGTFDPIHYGHLVAADTVRHEFNMKSIIFVPAGHPPHKTAYRISAAEHRYNMAVLATESNPYFWVSRIEVDRPGYSYTVDTMRQFRSELGNNYELYFITGADALLEIFNWKDVSELIKLCFFIAVTRPGYDLLQLREQASFSRELLEKIRVVEVPALSISSTDIRWRFSQQKPIRYLLPERVEEYINYYKLYSLPH